MTSVLPSVSVSPRGQGSRSESLRRQLSELNYLYPFSPDSVPLIEALLSDLVSTVTTYKELEGEHAITKEELRLAVEEINRVGVVENPRLVKENNELHVRLIQESDRTESKLGQVRKRLAEAEERSMKLELMVNQLQFENQKLREENTDLGVRVEQLVSMQNNSDENDVCSIWVSSTAEYPFDIDNQQNQYDEGIREGVNEIAANIEVPKVTFLSEENSHLTSLVSELQKDIEKWRTNYENLETKFLNQSPLTLSGNWKGVCAEKVIEELNSKLDFVNEKYKELKLLHARCGTVSDAPLVDLRESRKELNLLASRYEKLKSEKANLIDLVDSLKKSQNSLDDLKSVRDENRNLKKQIESFKIKKDGSYIKKKGMEEQLRRAIEEKDELVLKLNQIEASVEAMEKEVVKIEAENTELKREKMQKESSFLGISQQLNEVNQILNSLSEDVPNEERLKSRIRQLESEIVNLQNAKNSLSKNHGRDDKSAQAQINDLKALTKSLNSSKDQLVVQMRQLQKDLNEKRILIEELKKQLDIKSQVDNQMDLLRTAFTKLDQERDELQRLCDDQTEKLEVAREASAKSRLEIEQTKAELNHLRHSLEHKDIEIAALDSKLAEITRINQSQLTELTRLKNQASQVTSLIETLTVTESERNDVLALYKQVVQENKNLNDRLQQYLHLDETLRAKSEALARSSLVNQQLQADVAFLRTQLSELSSRRPGLEQGTSSSVSISSLNAQIKDLVSLVETERIKNRELQEYVEALSAVKLGGDDIEELQKTIDQQYTLIGEMDAEQAKLIVENNRLKLQLNQSLVP